MKKEYAVIIAGSRTLTDYDLVTEVMDEVLKGYPNVVIISGGAKGADKIGEYYAELRGYSCIKCLPDWDKYGKAAGIIRNEKMARWADGCVVFWDGESKGAAHMIRIAKERGVWLKVVNF
jgi:hypothetical protein